MYAHASVCLFVVAGLQPRPRKINRPVRREGSTCVNRAVVRACIIINFVYSSPAYASLTTTKEIAYNPQRNSNFSWRIKITHKKTTSFSWRLNNTQGNGIFLYCLPVHSSKCVIFLEFLRNCQKEHQYPLTVYFKTQEIHIFLEVNIHIQGNYIFLDGFILALKKIWTLMAIPVVHYIDLRASTHI
jgi:hypothetical protein